MSAIVISSELSQSDFEAGFRQFEQRGAKAADFLSKQFQQAGKQLSEALGGNTAKQSFDKLAQLREQAQAREQLAEANHQRKLVEINARAQAQIEATRERAAINEQQRIKRTQQAYTGFYEFLRRNASTIREAGESLQNAGFAFSQISRGIIDFGRAAVSSAISIDKQINQLKALTGSAEAAEKRFSSLVELSRRTPGLTTNLAATLDAQLRISNVSQRVIDSVLPTIGRINAVTPLGDPTRFAQNLIQLITQGFERADLKELVGQSVIAGDLIKQIFKVDSPTNAKAIREAAKALGIDSVEKLFAAMAEAAQTSPTLANVSESIATQLEKAQERVGLALRPLGVKILNDFLPAIEKAIPKIEELSTAFSRLSPDTQSNVIFFGALTAAIGPLVFALGSLIQTFGALGNIIVTVRAAIAGAGGLAAVLGGLNPIVLGVTAAVAAGAIVWYEYSRRTQEAAASIESAAKRARGSVELLTGEKNKLVTLGDGTTVNLLPGRDTSINVPGLPQISSPGFVAVDSLGRPLGSTGVIRDRLSSLTTRGGSGGGGRTGGGGGRGGGATAARTEVELLTEELKRAQRERDILLNPDSPEFRLKKQIADVRAEAERLREGLKGVQLPDLEEPLRKLKEDARDIRLQLSFLAPSGSREAAAALAATTPIPQVVRDIAEAAKEIPPAPAIFDRDAIREAQRAMEDFARVTEDLFLTLIDNGPKAFFSQLLDITKRTLVRMATEFLIFGRTASGSVGGGILGFVRNLFGGGGASAGSGGGGFLGNIFGGFGGFGGGIGPGGTAVFNQGAGSGLTSLSAGGLPILGNAPVPTIGTTGDFNNLLGGSLRSGGGFLKTLFSGAGGALLPLLGAGLGAGVGGQSTFGKILGGIGGGAVGLGLSYGASVFGALGGGLGALGPAALAALGPAALIGAPLLIGALLLGRAKQRRSDEQASGDFLTQALASIEELKKQAQSGQLTDVAQARSIFESQILATFVSQINTLKTASVRNSRLTNQTRDLRNVFEKEVVPLVTAAKTRARTVSRLVPEFHTGMRLLPSETFAIVQKGESVVTPQQYATANRLAGFDVLRAAGVPGTIGETQAGFPKAHNGGTYQGGGGGPVLSLTDLHIQISAGDSTSLLGAALTTADGQQLFFGTLKDGRRNGKV